MATMILMAGVLIHEGLRGIAPFQSVPGGGGFLLIGAIAFDILLLIGLWRLK